MTDSIAFDQAARYYDRTRALPPDTMQKVVARYAAALAGRGQVLEVGIGTGRMALPIAAEGIDLVGFDLAPAMLAQLVENAGGRSPIPLVVADATRIPLATAAVGAAYTTHVLHLVPDWAAVVREIVRVVRPGGVYIYDVADRNEANDELNVQFQRAAGITRRHVGLDSVELLDELMDTLGARGHDLEPVAMVAPWKPAVVLHNLEENRYSWTWSLDDATRRRAAAATRAWARDHYGDIDAPIDGHLELKLRVFDLPR